jgi:membrane protein required for colicin V production
MSLDDLPFNIVDGIVVVVLLGSGLLAFARGFIRELLAIVGWVGSILATFHLFPKVNFFARDVFDEYIVPGIFADAVEAVPVLGKIDPHIIADGLTILVIFVGTLMLFTMAGHFISRRVKQSGMGFLDRTLGFAFGLVRGAVVVLIAFLLLSALTPPDDRPEWLQEARVLPLLIYGGEQLKGLAPDDAFADLSESLDAETESLTAEEALRRLLEPAPSQGEETPPDSEGEKGYNSGERDQIEQLMKANEGE